MYHIPFFEYKYIWKEVYLKRTRLETYIPSTKTDTEGVVTDMIKCKVTYIK